MPEIDGEELARRIMHMPEFASTKLVLASSADRLRDNARWLAAGFAACLRKPIHQSELFDCLADLWHGEADAEGPAPAEDDRPDTSAYDDVARVRSLKILVVEDNHVNQLLATRTLQTLGHRTDIASNGVEAIRAIETVPYELVLMDVNMPVMGGVEATQEIRKMPGIKGRIPIIALTANAMKGDRERFLAAGMSDYLSKPLDRDKLIAAVNTWGKRALEEAPGPLPQTDEDAVSAAMDTLYERYDLKSSA